MSITYHKDTGIVVTERECMYCFGISNNNDISCANSIIKRKDEFNREKECPKCPYAETMQEMVDRNIDKYEFL